MSEPKECKLLGKWRITEADLWDKDHLDLCGSPHILIQDDGHGEIAFEALQAGLDLEYAKTVVFFTWEGFDEMDDVRGSGSADLNNDGTITIEFAILNADEAVLKAKSWYFSTAC